MWSAISLGFVIRPVSVVNSVGDSEADQPAIFFTLFHICFPVRSSSTKACSLLVLLLTSFLIRLFTLFFSCLQFSQSLVLFVLLAILLSLFLSLILSKHFLDKNLLPLKLPPPILNVLIGACASRISRMFSVMNESIRVGSLVS